MSRIILEPKHVGEIVSEVFDFSSRLASGETISSASTVATVYSGEDTSAAGIVSGAATISGTKVTQKIIGGVLGVTYYLVCSAATSAGQILQLFGYLTVTPHSL